MLRSGDHLYLAFAVVVSSLVFSSPKRSLFVSLGSVRRPAHISLMSAIIFSSVHKHHGKVNILATQCGHRMCILLIRPHPLHLLRLMRSFRAFPAICLERFLEYDECFFGTARRIESQIEDRIPDTLLNNVAAPGRIMAGRILR